jgi:hypothetical protein
MATLAETGGNPRPGGEVDFGRLGSIDRERGFFLIMAIAIAVTVVAGFALQLAAGRSTLASPWWVHVHGLTFLGWLGIYLRQNLLVWRGQTGSHRRFGRFAGAYVGWMVLVGIGATLLSVSSGRTPPFFEPNVFLVMDLLTVAVFAGLTWAAVRMRARTDWHRRLMLCGAIQVMTPGVGRLLPLPLLGTWIIWTIWAVILVYAAVAVTYDLVTRGKVHPAYLWGFGAITLAVALMRPLAFTPPVLAATRVLTG